MIAVLLVVVRPVAAATAVVAPDDGHEDA